jgi:hypothetical protein
VDDVVNAYEKLDEEGKSRCLHFLLGNHPTELLHPFTKEWKLKLEEMELGCDAPDEDSDVEESDGAQISEWVEDDSEEEVVVDVVDDDDVIDIEGEEEEKNEEDQEESEEYWEKQWEKAMKSNKEMEKLVERSVKTSTEFFKRQIEQEERMREEATDSTVAVEEMKREQERERQKEEENERRVKSKTPPDSFFKAAVRPFTYRNLVKEIVLMRHAIIDGEISPSKTF